MPPLSRAVARRLLRSRYAAAGARSTVRLLDSGSMCPLIDGTCTVEVRWRADSQTVKPGQLVLAGWDDLLLVHRIVDRRENAGGRQYLQMADNSDLAHPFAMSWLAADDVLAIVEKVTRNDGKVLYRHDRVLCRLANVIAAQLGVALWSARRRGMNRTAHLLVRFRALVLRCLARVLRNAAEPTLLCRP